MTTPESELRENGVYASNTVGTSMRPLFRTHRDMVIIHKPERELVKYDVALYLLPNGKYVLHRVIGVLPDAYICRGDNTFVRETVPKSCVIGVLTEFVRKGDRHGTVEDPGYRVYSRVWHFLYPVRFVFHLFDRALHKAYRLFKRLTSRKR